MNEEFGKLSGRILNMTKTASPKAASDRKVNSAFEALLAGDRAAAGEKIACLEPHEITELKRTIEKRAEQTSGAEMPVNTADSNHVAKERIVRAVGDASTEGGSAPLNLDVILGKGLGSGNGSGTTPAGTAPTISSLLDVPIVETIRTPDGAGDTASDIKKTAAFRTGFAEGIKDAVKEIEGLVVKHASYDIRARFGSVFDKMAAKFGAEAATDALVEGFAEGQKMAQIELTNNEEVKMGSLTKLAEDQGKIASVQDLRAYGRRIGREALLTKIAEDQAMAVEEAAPEEGLAPEVEEATETAAIVNAIAEKVLEDPESVTPEEAEVLLTVGDAIEDAEVATVGDEEKVTSIVNIAAWLRQYGYAN